VTGRCEPDRGAHINIGHERRESQDDNHTREHLDIELVVRDSSCGDGMSVTQTRTSRICGADLMQTPRRSRRQRLFTTLKTQARQLLSQYRLMLRAVAHPGVPWYAKAVCGCAALYVVSPIQLIPNFIPVLGQMDDVLVIGLSIKLLKRSVPIHVLDECQNALRPRAATAVSSSLSVGSSSDLRAEGSP
jgi:uncharacterized membrane protein YkvA (DUF1232 family)